MNNEDVQRLAKGYLQREFILSLLTEGEARDYSCTVRGKAALYRGRYKMSLNNLLSRLSVAGVRVVLHVDTARHGRRMWRLLNRRPINE